MIPGLVAAALAIAGGISLPHIARAITRTLNKVGIKGEKVKRTTERIEKSERIRKAIHEASKELNKKLPGVNIPGVGRVTVADIPVIGLAAEKALVDSGEARRTVKRVFKKYGIKADDTLVNVATSEAIRDRASVNLGSFLTEVGAAVAATTRVASLATKVVGKGAIKRGIINVADRKARSKLVGLITREAAIAGAAEGAANVAVQYGAHAPQRMNTHQFATDVAKGALIGGAISGIAGFGLGTAFTSTKLISTPKDTALTRGLKKVGRTIVDWSQELLDVQEKPGDIIAGKILGNSEIKIGVLTPTPTTSATSTTSTTSTDTSTKRHKRSIRPLTPSPSTSTTTSQTPNNTTTSTTSTTSTPTTTTTPSFSPAISPAETPDLTGQPPITPEPSQSDTGDITPTPDDETSPSPETEQTLTPTPAITPTPVPTLTPTPKYLPMPLMPAPYKEAPVLLGTAGRRIYVNELAKLKKLLRDMLEW